jgi:hypothetical protein
MLSHSIEASASYSTNHKKAAIDKYVARASCIREGNKCRNEWSAMSAGQFYMKGLILSLQTKLSINMKANVQSVGENFLCCLLT